MKKVIIFTCTMYFSYDVIMMCLDISQAELFGNAVQSHDSQDDSPNVSSFPPSPSLPPSLPPHLSLLYSHLSFSFSPHVSVSRSQGGYCNSNRNFNKGRSYKSTDKTLGSLLLMNH